MPLASTKNIDQIPSRILQRREIAFRIKQLTRYRVLPLGLVFGFCAQVSVNCLAQPALDIPRAYAQSKHHFIADKVLMPADLDRQLRGQSVEVIPFISADSEPVADKNTDKESGNGDELPKSIWGHFRYLQPVIYFVVGVWVGGGFLRRRSA